MKRINLFVALLAMTSVVGAANASVKTEISPYVSGKIGYNHAAFTAQELSNLNGFGGYAAVGAAFKFDVNNMDVIVRQELELAYTHSHGNSSSFNDASYSPWTVMGNMYVDFGNCNIRPYVGLGLGIAEVNLKWKDTIGDNQSLTNSAFNWGLYTGLNVDLTRQLTMDLGLRYNRAELIERVGDFQMFSAILGLRYHF